MTTYKSDILMTGARLNIIKYKTIRNNIQSKHKKYSTYL